MNNLINSYNQKKSIRHLHKKIRLIKKSSAKLSEMINSGKSYSDITQLLKERFRSGETLDSLLPDAFAVCQLASESIMGMKHYDVQIMGGLSLHKGSVAEMKTGEGKTLVATLPAYLNALTGEQVHVVTVNDYLAKRDAELMQPLYEGLGLSVGYIESPMENEERIKNYLCDIVYATSSQLGFDYLRDNMAMNPNEILQKKGLNYAIIDEIDSILIDDARTPLIISGQAELNEALPLYMNSIVSDFSLHWWDEKEKIEISDVIEDVIVDEKKQDAKLTESGFERLESLLISSGMIATENELYTPQNLVLINAFTVSVKACRLYKKETDYLVQDNKVKIISQNSGRIEEGRRWGDGLHQAIEAKEGVKINPDNQTMGSISLQNFFRLYNKLSGMSGTAYSESEEFANVYGMGVVRVPTHRPILRKDRPDEIFIDQKSKVAAIIKDIRSKMNKGQPVLVGTGSVEESDHISSELRNCNIPHRVLNAKNHENEAEIISQAGKIGAVTIATNMAGRGTDIILGGNLKDMIANAKNPDDEASLTTIKAIWKSSNKSVLEAGGLYVIGTSRNESRRVDDQLIGRSGRQGDPGCSKFYISFEDRIMRLFGDGKYNAAIRALGLNGEAGISHPLINKAVRKSQDKIDAHHCEIRKELLKFDDVANFQRKSIYDMRKDILNSNDLWDFMNKISQDILYSMKDKYLPSDSYIEAWDVQGMQTAISEMFNVNVDIGTLIKDNVIHDEDNIIETIKNIILEVTSSWILSVDEAIRIEITKHGLLMAIDKNWREQITSLEQLRQGIHLRGYAQKNPLQEYGKDALKLFEIMLEDIKSDFISICFNAFFDVMRQEVEEKLKLKEMSI